MGEGGNEGHAVALRPRKSSLSSPGKRRCMSAPEEGSAEAENAGKQEDSRGISSGHRRAIAQSVSSVVGLLLFIPNAFLG